MRVNFLIAMLSTIAALDIVVVVALYQHKKARASEINCIGEVGRVHTTLVPEGSVLLCGELWRAKSKDGSNIQAGSLVKVVGFMDHFALVDFSD